MRSTASCAPGAASGPGDTGDCHGVHPHGAHRLSPPTGPHRPPRLGSAQRPGSVLRGRRHAKPRRGDSRGNGLRGSGTARVRSCDGGPSAGGADCPRCCPAEGLGRRAEPGVGSRRRDDSSAGFIVKTTETTHGGRPRDLVWPAGSACPPGQRLTGRTELEPWAWVRVPAARGRGGGGEGERDDPGDSTREAREGSGDGGSCSRFSALH